MQAQIDQQTLQLKYQYDMQLASMKVAREKEKEQFIEDRKDNRTKLQATQQSAMIQQRQDNLLPTDFETQGSNQNIDPMQASML